MNAFHFSRFRSTVIGLLHMALFKLREKCFYFFEVRNEVRGLALYEIDFNCARFLLELLYLISMQFFPD